MLRLRCVLSSGCEHDRILELGDNRDTSLHDEATRHYNRCLRPPALHCLCYGTMITIREHPRSQATSAASNGGWQVVSGDKLSDCVNLLRMFKNAFWDKMPVPHACSVARFVIAQCNWDAMHATRAQSCARMLSSTVCACAMHTGMRSTPNIAGNFSQ